MKGASQAEKDDVAARGKVIQEKLKKELNILIDVPKQNFGNSNDGNTARKFFENVEKVSEILGKLRQFIILLF